MKEFGGRFAAGVMLAVLGTTGWGLAQTPPVPASYQDLYTSLSADIANFQSTINASWNRIPYPVTYCAQVTTANSNLGPNLLGSVHYAAVLLELDGLKALGVKAVSLSINFPVLYPGYYSNPSDYQQYLNFYLQLVSDIRARGLKLLIESRAVLTQDGLGVVNVQAYYNSLTLNQYEAGRAQTALIVAQQLKPDYLSVLTEPDTEAAQTGKSQIGTVSGATQFLSTILTTLQQAGVQGVAVGAGVGTWTSSYLQYIQSFAALPIQYVDMHVYPINRDYLSRAFQIADTARSYGKPAAMSETWVYKIRDSELGVVNSSVIYARDPYSFWAPLDTSYLQAMYQFAQYKQLLFASPFFSQYFRAYVDYSSSTQNLSPSQMLTLDATTTALAIQAGTDTATGLAYAGMLINPPDTTPPSAPTGLSALPFSPTSILLSWTAATDNVGVAGYRVYRNGILVVGTTAATTFTDTGLTSGLTYSYMVTAYDVAGNTTASATITAHSQDSIPPSVPTNLAVLSVSSSQVTLTWTPSTDNVAVAGYRVYRGSTPTYLAQIGFTVNALYTDSGLPPNTTAYYAVAAVDGQSNVSALTPTVSATTLLAADITPPKVSITAPVAGSTVSGVTQLVAAVSDLAPANQQVSGVAGVLFFVDGVPAAAEVLAPPYSLGFDTRNVSDGIHTVTAVARDRVGNRSTSAPVSITIKNH